MTKLEHAEVWRRVHEKAGRHEDQCREDGNSDGETYWWRQSVFARMVADTYWEESWEEADAP